MAAARRSWPRAAVRSRRSERWVRLLVGGSAYSNYLEAEMSSNEQSYHLLRQMLLGYGRRPTDDQIAFYLRVLDNPEPERLETAILQAATEREVAGPPSPGDLARRLGRDGRRRENGMSRGEIASALVDLMDQEVPGSNLEVRIEWLHEQIRSSIGLRREVAEKILQREQNVLEAERSRSASQEVQP